ncbi:MAG: response regulator transcription factor [Gemmatimonadaceae bacterium]|nr:response regulator transcription factor [Gemmatimonadaceae bacterium]
MTTGQLTILIVDDEAPIRRALKHALTAQALLEPGVQDVTVRVVEAATAREGIDLAAAERPALVILDLGLPDKPGIDVCREIRKWLDAPILVLSARHQDTEKAALLDAGADDYVTKPFSTMELVARVRAQLRRARSASSTTPAVCAFGEWVVDVQRRRVERAGVLVRFTPTEFALLRAFVLHPRQTLTHRQLFAAGWGNAEGDAQQYLRVYVGHLRRKLEDDPVRPRFIHTEPGIGYRFEPDSLSHA